MATTLKPADARLDLRLDPEIKQLATRASQLAGSRSLSEFVVQAIREKAIRVMEEAEVIRLSDDAFDAFQRACVDAPLPSEAMITAQKRRRQRIDSGELATPTAGQESA